jgi:hypothetical protein
VCVVSVLDVFSHQEDLLDGEDIAQCPSCTLRIRVIYDEVRCVFVKLTNSLRRVHRTNYRRCESARMWTRRDAFRTLTIFTHDLFMRLFMRTISCSSIYLEREA